MSKIPVGLQLYTLREETKQDFIGTLKKVAALGYQAVEFAGYGGIEAKEMRSVLDGLGLRAISSHVGIDALSGQLQEQIAYSQEIGASYIVCPWLPAEKLVDTQGFDAYCATFRTVGQACKAAGLTFAYHNHAFEFEQVGGQYLLDKLYASVGSDLMQAELDLYWVQKGGLNPLDYLLSLKGRVPLVHVKDMTGDESGTFAEVGHGIIDFASIFNAAEEAGIQAYIVEQDQCQRPPLESVEMSITYLKSIGIA
ncbi:sugar phosphate isomerase/epimerase family protein [Paenibacillus sp. MBLB4367]|uniref:sugar phosphate isomerase/epimerase family protein n=1 Tax=Paenibacillus sp. MBLB4367 TaxID=3384767 RepID=UPI0039083ABF